MFDHVKAAIAAGVHVAFLSGNAVDGVVALSPNGVGACRTGRSRGSASSAATASDGARNDSPAQWKQHGPDPATLIGARTT